MYLTTAESAVIYKEGRSRSVLLAIDSYSERVSSFKFSDPIETIHQ
ncbi:hypothetical protein [Aerosakkonema funiforme]|uniref:Uncharacterized protein n=1 Tax=Aerosakkonema funiforme FACHB-1375 TaxID=2949571 RepID=A0A926ZGU2_9CYAN|nr:hypothetical protein [Aerosakkonema funiforme]MBD2180186.1 hypothetical protein [Aerosakkonema funiforme FACHB-1375]